MADRRHSILKGKENDVWADSFLDLNCWFYWWRVVYNVSMLPIKIIDRLGAGWKWMDTMFNEIFFMWDIYLSNIIDKIEQLYCRSFFHCWHPTYWKKSRQLYFSISLFFSVSSELVATLTSKQGVLLYVLCVLAKRMIFTTSFFYFLSSSLLLMTLPNTSNDPTSIDFLF